MAKQSRNAGRPITVEAVRALATPESFTRGRRYFRAGAVSQLVRRGREVTAEVEGSEIDPYDVTIRLHGGGVAEARCTCPYDWGGYCKHIIAVLLKLGERPDDTVQRPAISKLLADLDRERLIALVEKRLESDPGLASWIEAEVATSIELVGPKGKGASIRRTLVDPAPVREQAQALIKGRYRRRRYWDDYRTSGSENDLQRLVERAVPFLEAGDGRNALRVLEPIAETFVTGWLADAHGTDEDMYLLFDDIARLIAEAALMGDISADERDDLAKQVEDWHDRLAEYGVEDSFPVAIRALESGWEQQGLQAVLSGNARSWPPRGRGDPVEARLTAVRLRVLEACDRPDEYLNLAKAAGCHTSYAAMLVKLERAPEAMEYAMRCFKAPSEAHALAKALREAEEDARALAIGEAGLALEGNESGAQEPDPFHVSSIGPQGLVGLAHWLRDYAGALGKTKLALRAAVVAFEQTHSIEDFRAAETWAGRRWGKVRKDLLENLTAAKHAHDRTRIFLEEGLIDAAVRSAGDARAYTSDTDTLMRLADAAHASHSDWVIRFATAKAASIMDNNRAPYYQEAARWLEKAALAYEAADRQDDWARELDALIDAHRRKYKLRPLLEALR